MIHLSTMTKTHTLRKSIVEAALMQERLVYLVLLRVLD
jgi:hypothetical protein